MSISNQRGAVLLLVLVVVALLSALLTDWAFSTLVDLRLTETFRDSNRAYYLARGGVEVGRQLLRDDRNGYDTPGEMWGVGVPSYPVSDDASCSKPGLWPTINRRPIDVSALWTISSSLADEAS